MPAERRLPIPRFLLVGLLTCLVVGLALPAEAAIFSGNLTRIKVRNETIESETFANSLVVMPRTRLDFTSSASGPVIVQFCAQTKTRDGGIAEWAAFLDGKIMKPGRKVSCWDVPPDNFDPALYRCLTWAADSVPAGPHVVKMKWRVVGFGSTTISSQMITVQFNKP